MRLKNGFSLILFAVAILLSSSATAGIGDSYVCVSTQYTEIKKDGEIKRYRPVKFELLWDSPKNSTEEIIWLPRHPELPMSETLYLVEKQPVPRAEGGEFFRFNLHPLDSSNIQNTGGLWMEGTVYLTFSYGLTGSITALIASCAYEGKPAS
jgi:hypothetical protein